MITKYARKVLVTSFLISTLLLTSIATPFIASGNGRILQFEQYYVGPYEIAIGTIPEKVTAGNLHISMRIVNAKTNTPIRNADITLSGRGPKTTNIEIGPLLVVRNPSDTASYDVNTTLDQVGIWTLNVMVTSELGPASLEFPLEVHSSNPMLGLMTLGALIGFLTILAFSARMYLKEKRRDKGYDQQQA